MNDHNHKIFTCPMHPEVQSNQPGLCPDCGMNLVPEKRKTVMASGHCAHHQSSPVKDKELVDKHAGHKTNIFKVKFWVSLVLSIPIVAYSEVAQNLLRYSAPVFPGSQWLPLVLASIIFFYGGSVFIISAFRELRARQPGMMTLIALAISAAYFYSLFAVMVREGETLFWELATLITIMLLGHWLEMRAVSGAQNALKELSKLLPDQAEVIREGQNLIVPLAEVRLGDIVLVKPGGKIPADGTVQEGISDVNESVVTGESKPVTKTIGKEVIAGTTNGDGSLKIQVTKIGEQTFLAGVMRLVAEAQASKSRLQLLSDQAAYYLTIVAVVTGGITFVGWLAAAPPAGGLAFAVQRLVAVLVIACPHALGLAVPLVASISTTKAARNGFLVKRRLALEAARNIEVVLFDKTGTLTKGEFGIADIVAMEPGQENAILRLAASVDSHSEHPIAAAIVREARQRGLQLGEVRNFQRLPGKGAKGNVDGKEITIGNAELISIQNFSNSFQTRITELAKQGKTLVFLLVAGKAVGALALADVIREESRQAVKDLQALGVKTAMITGDSEDVAKWVAGELGIPEYFARVLPDQKVDIVKRLQRGEATPTLRSGSRLYVGMVGDGVNDAPALTQADLGVAIGAGTNVAIESAGIILVKNDPRDIVKIIRLSRMTYSKMMQNLFWAAGYNIIAIPLAAGALAFRGIFLAPALAAVLMSFSTVIVAVNAILLRNKEL